MPRHTYFISDVHLNPGQPQRTQAFLSWCKRQALEADAVYILGDFFDAWIGNDDVNAFTQEVKQGLKQLSDSGVKVYFLCGNHDFLIDQAFARDTGLALLDDPSCIELYGERVLLTHGDFMCSDDRLHLLFRRLGQIKLLRALYLALPLSWRRGIARYLQRHSQGHIHEKNTYILDVNAATVVQWFKRHKVRYMIHGHTHKPEIHQVVLTHPSSDSNSEPSTLADTTIGQRCVLGCWYFNAEILVWYEDGSHKLLPAMHNPNLQAGDKNSSPDRN